MKRWLNWADDKRQHRAIAVILSVTLIGAEVLWVGALVLLVEKLVF
jgi:hypothetical protein